MNFTLVVTTNPGLEDVAADELAALALAQEMRVEAVLAPGARKGTAELTLEGDLQRLRATVPTLRAVHHVRRLLGRFHQDGLEDIARWFTALSAPELDAATRFRITGKRRGEHGFDTVALQRAAGAAVHDRTGLPVDLHHPDLDLHVVVRDHEVEVFVPYTTAPLSRRGERPYNPRTALGANVAWALLALSAGATAPSVVLDCCVGSGTVLSEAALRYPDAQLLGFDHYPEPVQGARANLAALGSRVVLREGDARDLATLLPAASVDLIVTNPPFGVRLGPNLDFRDWYRRLLAGAVHALRPGGRLGVLVRQRQVFRAALHATEGLTLVHTRALNVGNLWPTLFVAERR